MRRRVNGLALALAELAWRRPGRTGMPHVGANTMLGVIVSSPFGLANAHRRRAHDRRMLYFLRQVGANAPTIIGGEIFFPSNIVRC
jgi:hypothetical protein